MKLAELIAPLARITIMLGECLLERSGKMDQKRGFPCYGLWEVGISRPDFWQILLRICL